VKEDRGLNGGFPMTQMGDSLVDGNGDGPVSIEVEMRLIKEGK
jgi:hypothetical protein